MGRFRDMTMSTIRRVGTCIGLAMACLAAGALVAPGSALTAQIADVFVTNNDASSVPVHSVGTTQVTGTVSVGNLPATQPVSGTVNVGNFPDAAAVTTAKLVDTTLEALTTSNMESDIAVAAYRTVRLNVKALPACAAGTTTITVSESGAGANLARFDQFDVTVGNPANMVYQAPSTSIDVRLDGVANCEAVVKVWGRSN
jgi:hypothetical protein